MEKISIVTGGGTGIGKAIALKLAETKHKVLIIGRRIEKLIETQEHFPKDISYIQADIADSNDRQNIKDKIPSNIEFLIQNAAVLGEVTHIKDISLKEWQRVMAVNVEAPLFLTQLLLPRMENTRILHISSGAAHHAIEGWGAYCTSKAALFMIYEMLKIELKKENIITGSVKPGIVDTEMQDLIREVDLGKMPHLQKFHDLFIENELEPVERVAKFLYWILTGTTDKEYSKTEWDIRERSYLQRWDK